LAITGSVQIKPVFQSSRWIRILKGKNDPQKKLEKSEEFSCFAMLDDLFGGLKASPVAWMSFMEA
jgi:hypothetical protein